MNLNDKKDIEACVICDEHELDLRYENIYQNYSYKICEVCKQVYLSPFPTQEDFQSKYKQEEYYVDLSKPVKNGFIDRFLNFRLYKLPYEFAQSLKGLNILDRSILDVGCGNGEFLAALKYFGWNTYGSDLSSIAINNTSTHLKLDEKSKAKRMFHGEFSNLDFKGLTFNVVSFWHVLEHVVNPTEYLSKAYDLVKPGGYVIGEVPNFNSWTMLIFRTYYSWIMIPEHILYYTPGSLDFALRKAGFVDVEIINPNRGILNFAISFRNYLNAKISNKQIVDVLFYLTLPISILIMIYFSTFRKGEVLRFKARKY